MSDLTKKSAADAHEVVSAASLEKLKRRGRRERTTASRRDDLLANAQVHQVTVQGMPVSLPWLSFMARRDR
jgi:hypothetical protein